MKHSLRLTLSTGLALLAFTSCQGPAATPPARVQAAVSQSLTGVDGEGDLLRLGTREFAAAQSQGFQLSAQGVLNLAPGKSQGEWTSQALKAPFAFDALMPAWQASGEFQLQLRVSADGKNWGGWLPLFQERTMLLPNQAGFVQLRVTMQTGASLAGMSFSFGRQRATAAALPRRANPFAKPAIVSREGWNAAPPKEPYTPHTPVGIVIHHTWVPKQAQYQGAASIRGIQRYHMVDNKWNDIGYHFLIGPEGVIYQGRPETVIGSHSVPNTGMIGICVFGDYDPGQDPFTPVIRESLLNLLTWLTAEYGIQTSEFYGHRNFSPKSCPGDEIYNHLQEFKDEVTRRLQAAGVLPRP